MMKQMTAPVSNLEVVPIWERVAVFAFGVIFISLMLGIALYVPRPSDLQWRVFRLVLALAAGGIIALLPGVIQVTLTPWIRAGGAVAAFVLVYLAEPARLVVEQLPAPNGFSQAEDAAGGLLASIDAERYAEAFRMSHPAWTQQYQEEKFVQLGRNVRKPLGSVTSRTQVGEAAQMLTSGFIGHNRMYSYRTHFAGQPQDQMEYVWVLKGEQEEKWLPAGYMVGPSK